MENPSSARFKPVDSPLIDYQSSVGDFGNPLLDQASVKIIESTRGTTSDTSLPPLTISSDDDLDVIQIDPEPLKVIHDCAGPSNERRQADSVNPLSEESSNKNPIFEVVGDFVIFPDGTIGKIDPETGEIEILK